MDISSAVKQNTGKKENFKAGHRSAGVRYTIYNCKRSGLYTKIVKL